MRKQRPTQESTTHQESRKTTRTINHEDTTVCNPNQTKSMSNQVNQKAESKRREGQTRGRTQPWESRTREPERTMWPESVVCGAVGRQWECVWEPSNCGVWNRVGRKGVYVGQESNHRWGKCVEPAKVIQSKRHWHATH